jgi:parallel beta-helix repeat protein
VISGNRIFDNALGGGSGINMDGVQDSRIENNLVWNNHASGISLYMIDGAEGSSGNVVVNNTVEQPADGRWALNIQSGSTNNTVLNNILLSQHSYRGAIDISSDSVAGFTSDYNAVISRFTTDGGDSILSLGQWQSATGQDGHSLATTADALFVDWQAGDYRLKAGAPAINAGTSLQAPSVDLFGAPRVGAPDIGAIEFSAAVPTADFTGEGVVNVDDLAVWRTAFGSTAAADANRDGRSDGADFLLWQRQLGSAGARAVPEPGALAVVVTGLVCAACSRWRLGSAPARCSSCDAEHN